MSSVRWGALACTLAIAAAAGCGSATLKPDAGKDGPTDTAGSTNTITIAAQNGPASFAGCTGSCTFQTNPAGLVFGGTLTYH